jgi:hypothetical protein
VMFSNKNNKEASVIEGSQPVSKWKKNRLV